MERFAMEELKAWKERSNRKPLLLMGARQVGKTWLMKEFGRLNYAKTAYISFFNNKRASEIFESGFDLKRIILGLTIESGVEILPNDTLIIFDEIQDSPKVLESLKVFCEEMPEYNIIAAGSLLGVALHEGISFPVGKVEIMHLYPLNFREFLLAVNEETLEKALESKDPELTNIFHDKYLFWLRNYLFIGGMPAVVEAFRKNKKYKEVRSIQSDILSQYKGDFGKHTKARELTRINMVWDSIPIQLAKENRKFFFGKMSSGARRSEYEVAIQWLQDSGLIYKVHMVNKPMFPLKAYQSLSSFKLFFLDTGLLGAMSELSEKVIIEGNEIFVEFKGALTEQYVLQQLVSDTQYTPYYYGTDSTTFEQDFMIQRDSDIIPIEVKAAANVRSKSLKFYIDKFDPKEAIRFSALKYIKQDKLVNIPLYAVCWL
ncbi:MAG: AAA family ATPase [Sphaerochaetaceae bacterium]|nr:AAA family ATPase [Sphaerochaetaceae bacterium]